MLTIFRGDDMVSTESTRRICVLFNTCLDMTGWTAKFCLFDNVKSTTDISSHVWKFGYSSEETQRFPLGETFGKLIVFDKSGYVRRMVKVKVEVVTQKYDPCIAGTIEISVDTVITDYKNLTNKPILNGIEIDGSHDAQYYGLVDNAAIEKVVDDIAGGVTPISKLLFEVEGDSDNYYRIYVVMRDDGAGGQTPTFAFDKVPRAE